MADRYYDNNTGLYHVVAKESSLGFGTLDSKSVSVNPHGTPPHADSSSIFGPFKLIKADFRCQVSGTKGNLMVGAIDSSLNTWEFSTIDEIDPYDGFPIDACTFISNNDQFFNYRKVWKPKKYAQSGDIDLFMTIDPTGFWGILDLWEYSLSMYTVWKPL